MRSEYKISELNSIFFRKVLSSVHHISKDEALKKGGKDGCHVGCTFFLRYTNDYLEKGEEMTPGKPWKKIQIVANGNVMFVLFAINM